VAEDPSVQAATGAALVENNIFAAFGYPSQIDASTYRRTLLASEIQGAGPSLTPETFEAALLAARFPNPGAASAPFFQASGGYLGDSTFIDDVGLLWWDWGAGT
jgi:hypothetical protein